MSHASNKAREARRSSLSRHRTSPLWGLFASGMSATDLAHATNATVARPVVLRFLEAAVANGAATRRTEGGQVRYWKTEEAPEPAAAYVEGTMRPLRQAFAGRPIIPVRAGGVEMPIQWQGRRYETVGDREAE